MKKVYVASPVRPVFDACMTNGEALQWILGYAKGGCKTVKKMGFLPISPILAFDGVYDEFTEREHIDQACEELLISCDAIYVVQTDYNKESKGIARELEIAQRYGIPTLYVKEGNQ